MSTGNSSILTAVSHIINANPVLCLALTYHRLPLRKRFCYCVCPRRCYNAASLVDFDFNESLFFYNLIYPIKCLTFASYSSQNKAWIFRIP